MITVQTLENIMDLSGRRQTQAEHGRAVLSYLPDGWATPESCGVALNQEHLTLYQAGKRITRDGDFVTFWRKPQGTEFIIGLIITVVLAAASAAISALTAPSVPSRRKDVEESDTYGFDGLVNTVRPGTRIPIVYGEHRVAGHIIQQFLREGTNEQGENVGVLHSLVAVSSGPIDSIDVSAVTGLRIDKNPRENFPGVEPDFRLGTLHQSAIEGFHEVTTQVNKDAEISAIAGPVLHTTQSEIDSFELIVRFPGGLFRTFSGGNFGFKRVEFRVEHKLTTESTWTDDGVFPVESKKNAPFDAFFRSALLPRAKYQLRVTRLTPGDTTATGFSDSSLLAVNEILDDVQTYPRVAYYSVRQLPTNQVSGRTPQYDVLVRGKLVRVYTDTSTYTEAWSNSPAWCLLDLLTSKLDGLGAFIAHEDCDLQTFIDFAADCEEEGFTLNLVLDGSLSAFDAIKQICTVGRGFFLLRGSRWAVRMEKAEVPVQQFTMGRIGKGTFGVVKESRFAKANMLFGEFWNRALDYEQDSLPKEDQTLGPEDEQIEGSVNLMGVTSFEHANKILNYLQLSNRLCRRVIRHEVGPEALAMEAGDVFNVAHDVPGWGFSGKIRAIDSTGTQLWLDRTVTIESGKTYEVTVYHDATQAIDVVLVTSNPGTTDRITVSGDWSTTPVQRQDYSFGEVGRSVKQYRCLGITRSKVLGRRKILAREYDEDVYGDDLTVLPDPSITRLPDPLLIPADVTNLRANERVHYSEDGSLAAAIDVHFTLPTVPGVKAEVFWREKGMQVWDSVGIVTIGYASITENVQSPGATYEVAVASVSQAGNRKHPDSCPRVEVTTAGVLRQPDKVVGFRVDRTVGGLVFSWLPLDPVANFDLDYYEIRNGSTWDAAIPVGKTSDTVLETALFAKGTQTYLIKAFNTAGNGSFEAAAVILTVDGRIGENIIHEEELDPTFDGGKQNMSVVSNKLQLDTEGALGEWKLLHQTGGFGGSRLIPGGFAAGFRVTGSYTTGIFQITSGAAVRCMVATVLEQLQIDASLFWTASTVADLDWQSEFARTRAWAVAPDGAVKTKVEMRFSTATSADTDFGPWQERAQNIEALVKFAQARILVEVLDPSFTVQITKFRLLFDVPDVTESFTITTSASGTVTHNFVKHFNNAPKLAISVLGATAGDTPKHSSVTTTSVQIEVFDSGGSRVVRTVEGLANGF